MVGDRLAGGWFLCLDLCCLFINVLARCIFNCDDDGRLGWVGFQEQKAIEFHMISMCKRTPSHKNDLARQIANVSSRVKRRPGQSACEFAQSRSHASVEFAGIAQAVGK